jgi:hypothetical protein
VNMTRKEFLGTLAATAALAACGGGGGDNNPVTSCVMDGTVAAIGDNHGHVLNVTTADVVAGAMKTYDIMGTADHTHSVTVSDTLMVRLQNDSSAMVTSTITNGHSHDITITCAS